MKIVLGLFGLLFVLIFAIMFFQNNPSFRPFSQTPQATIKNQTFSLLLAKDPKTTQVGLSEKTSLPQNQGMLFIFERPDRYAFWMKNMKFPLDIIYINNNKIVTIIEDAQPPKNPEENPPIFTPDESADKVLEINAGLSKKFGFEKGDEVKFQNL